MDGSKRILTEKRVGDIFKKLLGFTNEEVKEFQVYVLFF